MDPISNQVFNHDYPKFVYQRPDVEIVSNNLDPRKPFILKAPEKSDKAKEEDLKKLKEQAKDNNNRSRKKKK